MKKLSLTIFALLAAHSVASAQTPSHYGDLDKISDNGRFIARFAEPTVSKGFSGNANECAPGKAEPIWSATSALVGYACSPASANGG